MSSNAIRLFGVTAVGLLFVFVFWSCGGIIEADYSGQLGNAITTAPLSDYRYLRVVSASYTVTDASEIATTPFLRVRLFKPRSPNGCSVPADFRENNDDLYTRSRVAQFAFSNPDGSPSYGVEWESDFHSVWGKGKDAENSYNTGEDFNGVVVHKDDLLSSWCLRLELDESQAAYPAMAYPNMPSLGRALFELDVASLDDVEDPQYYSVDANRSFIGIKIEKMSRMDNEGFNPSSYRSDPALYVTEASNGQGCGGLWRTDWVVVDRDFLNGTTSILEEVSHLAFCEAGSECIVDFVADEKFLFSCFDYNPTRWLNPLIVRDSKECRYLQDKYCTWVHQPQDITYVIEGHCLELPNPA